MELIYTDIAYRDVGVLSVASGDFSWGIDNNNYSVTLTEESGIPAKGALVYCEGEEMGGIVRGISVDERGLITISGMTWTGMLGERILCPPSGQAYFSVGPCDASDAVRALFSRLGLDGVFFVEDQTGIVVSHKFAGTTGQPTSGGRFMNGWAALWQLLFEHSLSAAFAWDASKRKVSVSLQQAQDRTDEESLMVNAGSVTYKDNAPVNHLVCLGQGELENRTTLHLYSDIRGNISRTQTISGLGEIAEIFDDSAAASVADLEAAGISRFKELRAGASEVNVLLYGFDYMLGDIVGGTEPRTGVSATAIVTQKTATLPSGAIQYGTYTK